VLVALVAMQITLGALTVLSRRNPWINSFHVLCGALVLTTSLVITLRSWRGSFANAAVTDAAFAVNARRGGPMCPPGPTHRSAPTTKPSGARA